MAGIYSIPRSTNVVSWHFRILTVMFLTVGDDLTSFILDVQEIPPVCTFQTTNLFLMHILKQVFCLFGGFFCLRISL